MSLYSQNRLSNVVNLSPRYILGEDYVDYDELQVDENAETTLSDLLEFADMLYETAMGLDDITSRMDALTEATPATGTIAANANYDNSDPDNPGYKSDSNGDNTQNNNESGDKKNDNSNSNSNSSNSSNNSNDNKNFFQKIADAIKKVIEKIKEVATNLGNKFKAAFDTSSKIYGQYKDYILNAPDEVFVAGKPKSFKGVTGYSIDTRRTITGDEGPLTTDQFSSALALKNISADDPYKKFVDSANNANDENAINTALDNFNKALAEYPKGFKSDLAVKDDNKSNSGNNGKQANNDSDKSTENWIPTKDEAKKLVEMMGQYNTYTDKLAEAGKIVTEKLNNVQSEAKQALDKAQEKSSDLELAKKKAMYKAAMAMTSKISSVYSAFCNGMVKTFAQIKSIYISLGQHCKNVAEGKIGNNNE